MAWVAFDRAVSAAERFDLDGPVDRWRALRDDIHREVSEKGCRPERNAFTQYYGSEDLDASLLMIPLVGFLPATDPRMVATVAAIERELLVQGLRSALLEPIDVDGLPPGEGAFLPCTFWLADNLVPAGPPGRRRRLFERLLGLRNDVGLLSEEYDPDAERLLGNFPQAFSHVSLVNTARNLPGGRAGRRGGAFRGVGGVHTGGGGGGGVFGGGCPKAAAGGVATVEAIAGVALAGDRYAVGTGTYWNPGKTGQDITFIEGEVIDRLAAEQRITLAPGDARRNVVTRGVALSSLLGRRSPSAPSNASGSGSARHVAISKR